MSNPEHVWFLVPEQEVPLHVLFALPQQHLQLQFHWTADCLSEVPVEMAEPSVLLSHPVLNVNEPMRQIRLYCGITHETTQEVAQLMKRAERPTPSVWNEVFNVLHSGRRNIQRFSSSSPFHISKNWCHGQVTTLPWGYQLSLTNPGSQFTRSSGLVVSQQLPKWLCSGMCCSYVSVLRKPSGS